MNVHNTYKDQAHLFQVNVQYIQKLSRIGIKCKAQSSLDALFLVKTKYNCTSVSKTFDARTGTALLSSITWPFGIQLVVFSLSGY